MAAAMPGNEKGFTQDVDLHSQHLLLDIISPISFDYSFDLLGKSRNVITGVGASYLTLVPIRPRSRGERRSLRTFAVVSLRPRFQSPSSTPFNAASDAFQLHPGVGTFKPNKMLEAYHRSAEIMGEVILVPLPLLKLGERFGIGRLRELIEAYDSLEVMGEEIIKRRRDAHKSAEAEGKVFEQNCLLDTMLFMEDEDGNLAYTDEELWGDVNDIMAAGHQTQAATMSTALLYVSRDEKVKRAIEREVAALGGRAPTFEDVSEGRLAYTQSVIKETLRLHPPIHMFPRLAAEDDVMPTGHEVKAGDLILLSTWAMGRNPSVWESPLEFDPDRFTDERLVKLARDQNPGADDEEIDRAVTMLKSGRDFIYTPFGAGPRSCIGGLFSLLTVTTIVASCVQRFDFTPDEESLPADAEIPLRYDVTMCFPKGLKMRLRRRDLDGAAEAATPGPAVAAAR
jgi:cytochrome P450